MSFFSISNIPISGQLTKSEGDSRLLELELSDYKINILQSYNFNSKIKQEDQYSCIILGNPIYKNSFTLYWENTTIKNYFNSQESIYELFSHLNGIAAVLIMDKKNERILIASDPMGFFPIFMIESEEGVLITNEIKQFKSYPSLNLELHKEAIIEYYLNGHFLSGNTWFKNCRRMLPSSYIILNMRSDTLNSGFYWTWRKVIKSSLPKEKLIEEYYTKFHNLFESINFEHKKVGVGLSGGLDSRWVISELNKTNAHLSTFTLSQSNSLDLIIAKKISNCLNLEHHTYQITYDNWFEDRLQQFWTADGLLPIQHFHEGPIYSDFNSRYDLIATGFYGGGIYSDPSDLNCRINTNLASKYLNFKQSETYSELQHFDILSIDPYLSWQKISQCGAIQVYTMSKSIPVLIPYYNMDWLTFNYSIDEKQQLYSKFFLEVLNKHLPPELSELIWQRTLLKANLKQSNFLVQYTQLNKIIKLILQKLGAPVHFVDYSNLDQQINNHLSKLNFPDFLMNIKPKRVEDKLRYISILLFLKMYQENTAHVL